MAERLERVTAFADVEVGRRYSIAVKPGIWVTGVCTVAADANALLGATHRIDLEDAVGRSLDAWLLLPAERWAEQQVYAHPRPTVH